MDRRTRPLRDSYSSDGSRLARGRRLRRAQILLAVAAVASAWMSAMACRELGVRPGRTEVAEHAAVLYRRPGHRAPVRILALGDSITQGGHGAPEDPIVESYRRPLFQALVERNVRFDFVGSSATGFNDALEFPGHRGRAFDADHEGHWGWTTRAVREKLPEWLGGYDVDIALVLLGGNDVAHGMSMDDTIDELGRIIDLLRADNPRVVVLLGQVYHDWWRYRWLRVRTAWLAEEKNSRESPVVAVDHGHGWVSSPEASDTLTFDWVHPNRRGDARLAQNWLAALTPFLERFEAEGAVDTRSVLVDVAE